MLWTLCDGHGGNGPSDADDDLKPEAWDECRAGCLDHGTDGILTIPANLIGGKMADRFNKKMNIVYLDMISVISYIICGLIPLTTKSIVLMFIASTCQNIENPSYNSLTADITLSKDRERGYSLQYLDSKSRRRDGFCCSRIYVSQLLMACIFAQWNFHRHFFCADLFLCTEYHTGKRRK